MCEVITDRVTLRHGLHEVTRRYIDTQRCVVLFTTQVIFWYYAIALMTSNTMLLRRHAKYLILATTHTVFWFLVGLLFRTVWCVLFVAYIVTGAVSRGHVLMYGIMTFHDQSIIYYVDLRRRLRVYYTREPSRRHHHQDTQVYSRKQDSFIHSAEGILTCLMWQ